MPIKVLEARKRAGVVQTEVSAAIGRGQSWLVNVEQGKITITSEEETAILKAIARLSLFKARVAVMRDALVADLRLPPAQKRKQPHKHRGFSLETPTR